jgi:hypothetical protein
LDNVSVLQPLTTSDTVNRTSDTEKHEYEPPTLIKEHMADTAKLCRLRLYELSIPVSSDNHWPVVVYIQKKNRSNAYKKIK